MSYLQRADYMSGKCTHEEFYRAIAKTAGIRITDPKLIARVKRALERGDTSLNTIPLSLWDAMSENAKGAIFSAAKLHGDFYSLGIGVCVMKQAAREAAEEEEEKVCL